MRPAQPTPRRDRAEYFRAYRAANKERIRAIDAATRERNREKLRERGRERRARSGRKSLEGPGYVYVISVPAYPGFCKVGHTNNLDRRLSHYNTGSPFRDYEVYHAVRVEQRLAFELRLLDFIGAFRVGKSEWFQLHPEDVKQYMISLTRQEQCQ